MPRRHAALALIVAVCWAVNFVVMDIDLESLPPLLFVALRFGLTASPGWANRSVVSVLGRPLIGAG